MSLRILHIAYPYAPVGPRTCGGAEQVLTDLDRALVAAGHSSSVVACEGSRSAGHLYSAPVPHGRLDSTDSDRRFWQSRYQGAIDRALNSERFDLVHMHGLDWHHYRLPANLPVLVTLHMPIAWYPSTVWDKRGRNLHFQCVSTHQRQTCPDRDAAVVENGVALPSYDPRARSRRFALALGRICPEKNLHEALSAGTIANVPVRVGGQTFPYSTHLEYERSLFRPALRGNGRMRNQHRFLGPLPPRRKQHLLAAARCLLHPTLAPETSSLVTMEALAAGTPVIAYRSGALPDIIEHGVTGFLVNNVAEMGDRIAEVDTLDRNACRRAAEQRFSLQAMTRGYLDLYTRILEQGSMAHPRYA
ncbi:glycosyltransferase family 4 protein [Terriglobus aquaticus]|uniref:Glycosyltransferase family 4 protein n=1 Tax=Terriglobus aquaticus TaxID=940139 RepID=A0ABW9KQ83_9BACT|nr:glycosyltransferase family 4 protein [Terriglobus aquaticus]